MNILIFENFEENYLRENEIIFNEDRIFAIDLNDMNPELEYDEKIHDLIDRKFNQIMNSHLIIINDSAYELGFRITHHFRFGNLRKPIFIIGDKPEYEILAKYPDSSRILSTSGTLYVLEDQLVEKLHHKNISSLETSLEQLYQDTDSLDSLKAGLLDKVVVKEPEKQGRHSIANQWGAYRMAQVGDLKIEYPFPNTLYFKYLTALSKPIEKSINLSFSADINILLIDDNYLMGWKALLEGIFGNGKIDACNSWDDAVEKKFDIKIKKDQYDLIFLDFYLDEGERIDRIGKGRSVLEIIKGKKNNDDTITDGLNPVVPVIMFTASNKAWNMDELYEAGADGYYVKEHPETAHDVEFSIQNFKNFHKTVESCLKKGTLLRKYWRKIKEIENSDFIVNNSGQKNKERINERLIMFLGLLKKAFEQTKFDKDAFFYSEWELAFLTLWSTLNEIQEVHYEKNNNFVEFSFTDNQGIVRKKVRHPRGSRFIPNHLTNWKIKNSNEYLIAYRPAFDLNGQPKLKNDQYYDLIKYSTIFRDSSKLSGIRLETEYSLLSDERWRYEKNLSIQISFLIYNFSPTETLDRDNLTYNLLSLNDNIRNKLYLTHGEDSSSPNFALEYKDKDQRLSDIDWQKHIKQLFEIVNFLCTGKECDWNK